MDGCALSQEHRGGERQAVGGSPNGVQRAATPAELSRWRAVRRPTIVGMQALLVGGPNDQEVRDVPERPPSHIDVEVDVGPPWQPIPEGGEFPQAVWATHRYVLSGADSNPNAPEPRARYTHLHKLPED